MKSLFFNFFFMIQDFKKFILRGNVLDLAVAVIIGGAFNKIVTSLVNDLLMPPIGYLMGGVDFSNLFLTLDGRTFDTLAAAEEAGVALIKYGMFINTVIDFLIIAATIFVVIKAFEKMQKKEVAAPAEKPKPCAQEVLLTEIRDLLKKK